MRKRIVKRLLALCLSVVLAFSMDAAPLCAAEYADADGTAQTHETEPGVSAGAEDTETEEIKNNSESDLEEDALQSEPDLQISTIQNEDPADAEMLTGDASILVTTDGSSKEYSDIYEAWTAADGHTATVRLLKDVNLSGTSLEVDNASSDITLEMADDVKLISSAAPIAISVSAGRLTLAGGIVKASGTSGSSRTGIQISGGNVTIDNGSVESSGSSGITHHGIQLKGGSLTINGGTVNGTHGVQITETGSAIITGGTVSGSSYGVHVTDGSVSVSGEDTKVEAGSGGGDGIYVGTSGSATVNGGTITASYSGRHSIATDGGDVAISGGAMPKGVWIKGGKATISGGSISGSTGLYVNGQGDVTIKENAQISGTSTGLSADDGTVTIDGGTITGEGGGSVYGMKISQNGNVTIHGGAISGHCSNYMGFSYGISITGGSLVLNGGVVKAFFTGTSRPNSIYDYGIHITGGNVQINGGSIIASDESEKTFSCSKYGWGIFTDQDGSAILSGGTYEGGTSAVRSNNSTVAELLAEACAYLDSDSHIIEDTDSALPQTVHVVKLIDISEINWEAEEFTYNGNTQGPVLTGDIPEGVTVTKTGDSAVYAGDYTALATFALTDGYSPEKYMLVGTNPISKVWSIKKAPRPSNTPPDVMEAAYACQKIGDVTLPENWKWEDTAKALELTEGVPTEATAFYTGEDKGNYETESVTVQVTRKYCTHENTEIKNVKASSCTETGYTGDTVCTACGAVVTPGTALPALGHDYHAQITQPPTAATEGTMLYTCSRCQDTYTESIPKTEDAGEVLPDDIPEEGIPDGLWIAGVEEHYTYTGSAVRPSFRVYSGNRQLLEKRDYTVSYKNNINAGTASLTVKGKGNYGSRETSSFEILPAPLDGDEVKADDLTISWNGKEQKPLPTVSYHNKKLKNKKDYTVSYRSMGQDTDTVREEGSYEIILTATENGNFSGSKTLQLTVTKRILMSKVKVSKIKAQSYDDWNGQEIRPALTVKAGKKDLIEGQDYDAEYKDNTSIGTATVTLTGKNDYAGTKTVTFKVTGKNIKKANVTGLTDLVYSGLAYTPKPTVSLKGENLLEGVNYSLTYEKNVAAGKATIIITGINNCTGVLKKTFRITPFDLEGEESRLVSGLEQDITVKYVKGGCKPKPELLYQDVPMKEGTDYTIRYKYSQTTSQMIIKGKGNFKGTLTKPFTVEAKALNDQSSPVKIFAADMGYANKPGKFMSAPILTDADGTRLIYGKDYENIVYVRLTDPDTALTKKDQPQIGELIKVKVSGKGMYAGGDLETVYRITETDFRKAKIRIFPQDYTGDPVTLDPSAIQSVKINGKVITDQYGEAYEIMPDSYKNNIKKGTASVTICGKGSYGGTVTVKFKIGKKKFSGFLWF